MKVLRNLAHWSLCLAVLGLGTTTSPARAEGPGRDHDQGRHLGWVHKPDHLKIVTQPLSQTIVSGQAVTFKVEVTGKPSRFHYQWLKGHHRVGGDSASYTIPATTAASAGVYTVIVSNPTGWVHSHPATLAINVPPVITAQPAGLTVVQGANASFSVAAKGNGTLGYQWRKGGSALAGATSATLNLAAVTAASAGTYDAVVTNTVNGTVTSATSTAAALQVNVPPVFTLQPVSQTVDLGAPLALSVAASANQGSLAYQWRKDGQPIAGATSTEFGIAAIAVSDAGSYDAVATCTLDGTVTSTASLAAAVAVHAPPTILAQPQSRTVLPPDAVTFTVSATANHGGALTYSWRKNGTAIDGATTASYTVASTEFPTNADAYSVLVSDGTFQVESATVYATASVPSPVYAGDPVPVPSRPLTVLPSLHVDPVNYPNGAFRLGYDESLKNPVWTSYLVFPVHQPYANSTKDYVADTRLAAPQVGKDDYTGIYTGGAGSPDSYDRGHQVPRADVSYRYTPVAGDDATIMSNLVPQISQFNQQLWQRLEETIGGSKGGDTDGITSYLGRVWVYTGSYFPPSPAWWASKAQPGLNIAIPTACYKIVVSEATPGQPKALALILPNAWGLVNAPETLTTYVTSVARIEALTGLDFFPNLQAVAPGLDIPAWKANVEVRGWRAPFEQTSGPNVHMVEPSWDTTVNINDTVTFAGAATPNSASAAGTAIASATWNFGDGTPVSTGMTASHTYSLGGSFSASFTVQDSLGASNTITRVIKVKGGNEAPTFTGVSNQSTTAGSTVTASFKVADDSTAPGALTVNATADNTVLLPSALVVDNAAGTCTLALIPAAGATGSAIVTLTVTDGDGASTTATFTLTVTPGGVPGAPSLIISQYYEGASFDKWIEVTNVGSGIYDAAVTPIYLGLWTNPNTSNTFKTALVSGTLAPGASFLLKHSSAALPDAAHVTNGASAVGNSNVANFNGNDAVFLSPVGTATSAAWDARIDTIGDLSWGAANPAADKSYYRLPSILAGNPTYTATEWVQKTMAEVNAAVETDSARLGYHIYNK
ncbi:immunoglobulin domain-containing protein [Geothrix sp. 21YS21S-2]|uniref:immunoglobulin domain-containing protein n=1 Tax=Geothrix sp. 21YS21S-2 TaxID=3068893 RepID=UPI0027B9A1CA|nr:immunoglobulin domain-containing protein [Geothrix sp. 21YS21S-2]